MREVACWKLLEVVVKFGPIVLSDFVAWDVLPIVDQKE